MRKEKTIKANTAPAIKCQAPWRLAKVKPLANYCLAVEFNDGVHGFVNMEKRIKSRHAGIFSALKDINLFNQVYLSYGVATWPNAIDLAPDTMHDAIKTKGKWVLDA